MLNTKNFYELMKLKGVRNISELARKTKIPYTTIGYMLSGHDMHVSSLIELAHFFKVPIDTLINKSYGITVFTEDDIIECPTTNIYEATMSTMM